MKRRNLSVMLALLVIMLVMVVSACDLFGKKYTIEAKSYITGSWVYIEYRESGSTEWIDADLYDADGYSVSFLLYSDATYPSEAFFDLPDAGTYDFRGVDILGVEEGNGVIADKVVEFDNMGSPSAYSVNISTTSSVHGFY